MTLQLIRLIHRHSNPDGIAPIAVVLAERGEEASDILSDCLIRSFVQHVDPPGSIALTTLGMRYVTD